MPLNIKKIYNTHRISWLFAVALTHHAQVYDDFLVDADGVDLDDLVPLPGVFRALQDLNLGSELNP